MNKLDKYEEERAMVLRLLSCWDMKGYHDSLRKQKRLLDIKIQRERNKQKEKEFKGSVT